MSVTKAASGVGSPQGNSLSPPQVPGEGLEKKQPNSGCPYLLLSPLSPGHGTRSTAAALQAPTNIREEGQILNRALDLLLNCVCSPVSPSVRLALADDSFDLPNCAAGGWQGQGCLLGTIKAYLSVYLVAEALCTKSKSQG